MPKRLNQISKNLSKFRFVGGHFSAMPLAIIIGILGGFGALYFNFALHWFSHVILNDFAQLNLHPSNADFPRYLFFLIPTLGGLFSGIIVYSLAPEAEGHGTDAMINTFHNKGGKIRKRVPFVKAIASICTISSGGSAGVEGPVAQIGSGLGSILTRYFKMPTRYRRIMTLAGTAAGLGAIFKAPLGGALTSVEILYKEDFESDAFMTSIIASVVAYAVYCTFTSYTPLFGLLPGFTFTNVTELIFYAILGVLCAPFSWFYVKFFYLVRDNFKRLPIKNHLKPALGGLVVGLLFYVRPEILGGGWNFLIQAMDGSLEATFGSSIIIVMFMIAVFKIIATSFTVGSGGSGGVFGPSLFIGGMFGGVVGLIAHGLFPEIVTQPAAYILVGMGAFFSGVANAPIAATIMVCELTGNYSLLAPLLISSVVHITLTKKWSIYENQLENKFQSPAHFKDLNIDILQKVKVGDFIQGAEKPIIVSPHNTLKELEHNLMENNDEDMFIVMDNNKLVGLLDIHVIRKAIFDPSVASLVIVEDLMNKPHTLSVKTNLHAALQRFLKLGLHQLPVKDSTGNVVAMLRHKDIIQAYDETIRHTHKNGPNL